MSLDECPIHYVTKVGEYSGQCFVILHQVSFRFKLSLPQTDATDLLVLHGGEVDTIGRVGAFVPRVHLGGSHTLFVSIHLEDGKENVRDNNGGGDV